MRNDQSLKQYGNNMASTHIPTYHSIRNPEHPNEMRVNGRYGQTSIPGSVFLNRNSTIQPAESLAYELERSIQQQGQATSYQPVTNPSHQAHHPLPLYTYGQRQQCPPCGPVMVPVYYEQPMEVREQWQRPLDPRVKQQQWRFAKTEDKGGIVKYVTKDESFVETTGNSRWEEYYGAKRQNAPPVIVPERQKKTCCTPVLFAFVGFIALIGLIVGLVLLLNAHKQAELTPAAIQKVQSSYVDPKPGKVVQVTPFIPVTPLPTQTFTPVKPIPVTRPTSTEPITAQPTEKLQTSQPTTLVSQEQVINTPAVSISYGYQSNQPTYSEVNYNNDYQLRPLDDTSVYTMKSQTAITQPSIQESMTVQPVGIAPVKYTITETPNIGYVQAAALTHSGGAVNQPIGGNSNFRVPEGYKIDEFGMLVPV